MANLVSKNHQDAMEANRPPKTDHEKELEFLASVKAFKESNPTPQTHMSSWDEFHMNVLKKYMKDAIIDNWEVAKDTMRLYTSVFYPLY